MSQKYDMSGVSVNRIFPAILKHSDPRHTEQLQQLNDEEKQEICNMVIDFAVFAYINGTEGARAIREDLVDTYFKYHHGPRDELDENLEAMSTEHLAAHIILSELSTLDTARALYPNRKEMQTQMRTNDNQRNKDISDQIKNDLASNDPLLKKRAILQQQLAAVIKQIQLRDQRQQQQQNRSGGSSLMSQMEQK